MGGKLISQPRFVEWMLVDNGISPVGLSSQCLPAMLAELPVTHLSVLIAL